MLKVPGHECPACGAQNGHAIGCMANVDDPVNHPSHYTTGNIEVLDFILDQQFNFLAGQVIKYVSRYRHKGTAVQDLEKAEFYLKRLIAAEQVKSDT